MTYRALELLNLPPDEPAFLLDIGCGSGLSGEILDEEGHIWAGVDVAPSMLGAYVPLFTYPSYYDFKVDVDLEAQRLRSNGRSKVICSSKTSDRVLASDLEALTERSGACNTNPHAPLTCLLIHLSCNQT